MGRHQVLSYSRKQVQKFLRGSTVLRQIRHQRKPLQHKQKIHLYHLLVFSLPQLREINKKKHILPVKESVLSGDSLSEEGIDESTLVGMDENLSRYIQELLHK